MPDMVLQMEDFQDAEMRQFFSRVVEVRNCTYLNLRKQRCTDCRLPIQLKKYIAALRKGTRNYMELGDASLSALGESNVRGPAEWDKHDQLRSRREQHCECGFRRANIHSPLHGPQMKCLMSS